MLLDLPDSPVPAHKFCGYYFKYPGEEGHLGLVSTIMDDPPMLNWLFVDAETKALRHGGRKDTIGHVIGPWGWSADERFFTLQGDHTTFVARKQEAVGAGGQPRTLWGVYWDPDGEMLEELEPDECRPLRLQRKPVLGMESRYTRDK